MVKRQLKKLKIHTTLAVLLMGLMACQPGGNSSADPDKPGQGKTVDSAKSSLLEERFQTEIVNIALEELGYEIEPIKEIEYPSMLVAIANGDLDYTPVHWEKLHTEFFDNAGGEEKMERVGVLTPDTVQGYQIDKATADRYNITNIEQLKDPEIAKVFDSDGDGKANLVGCDPGWGCELVIEHHLEAYGLRDTVEHDKGKYTALIADAVTRYKQGEPVLYYTWQPFWLAAELKPDRDTMWLEVPFTDLPAEQGALTDEDTSVGDRNLGFAVDNMKIVANKEFLANNPAAQSLFNSIKIPIEDINAQNQLIKDGEDTPEDIRRHAEEWIQNNQQEFDAWLEEARNAAS